MTALAKSCQTLIKPLHSSLSVACLECTLLVIIWKAFLILKGFLNHNTREGVMLNGTLASGLCLHSLKHCCATLRSFHMDNVHCTSIPMDLDSNHWHTRVFVKYLIVSNLRLTKFKHHVFFSLLGQVVSNSGSDPGGVRWVRTNPPLALDCSTLVQYCSYRTTYTIEGRVHYCSCRTTYTIIGYSTVATELPALQSTCIILSTYLCHCYCMGALQ